MYECTASIEAKKSIFFYLGDTLLEYRNTSIGNIASGEIEIPIKADDNGAMYKCTASNKATEVPLEAVKKLTVHCKLSLLLRGDKFPDLSGIPDSGLCSCLVSRLGSLN